MKTSILLDNTHSNIDGSELDNHLSNVTGNELTITEIASIYKSSGASQSLDQWLKTESGKNLILAASNKKNGEKRPLVEWLKQDSTKQLLKNAADLATTVKNQKQTKGAVVIEPITPSTPNGNDQVTIFGLHPVTFTVTAALIITGTILIISGIRARNTTKK